MRKVITGFMMLSMLITGIMLISSLNQIFAQTPSGDPNFDEFFDEPTAETLSGNTSDTFVLKAQLKENTENQFIEDEYDVKKFGLLVSNESQLCPADCTFKFVHDDFDGFSVDGVTERSLQGSLKITEGKKTMIFPVNSDLQVVGEQESSDNDTIELLEGNFDIGKDLFNPDSSYFVNGTLTWTGSNSAQLVLTGALQN